MRFSTGLCRSNNSTRGVLGLHVYEIYCDLEKKKIELPSAMIFLLRRHVLILANQKLDM